MMSPLAVEIMLQCHCSAEPWQNMQPRIWNSRAAQEVRDMLKRLGLLDAELRSTEKGRRYVEAICAVEPLALQL